MFAIAALSAGSMYFIMGATSEPSAMGSGSLMTGNVEVVVRDESGQITAYRQSDNHIVATGMDILAKQTFFPSFDISATGNHTNAPGGGWVRYMEIGNGTDPVIQPLDWDDETLDGPLSSFTGCNRVEAAFTHEVGDESSTPGFAETNVTAVALFNGADGCVAENIKEAGIWQNSTSGPGEGGGAGGGGLNTLTEATNKMFARNTFGNVTLQATDSLQLTWRFTFTDS